MFLFNLHVASVLNLSNFSSPFVLCVDVALLWKHTAIGANQGNLLSIGTPFDNQLILGLGLPLALQIRVPSSPGDSTRFWGAMIQYGAASWRKENTHTQNLNQISFSSKLSILNYLNNKINNCKTSVNLFFRVNRFISNAPTNHSDFQKNV